MKVFRSERDLEVTYGATQIPFTLYSETRSRITISVHPDMRVTVKAPFGKTDEEVRSRVKKRASWIDRQLRHFEKFQPLLSPRKYIGGETHLYLGRQYRLKVRKASSQSIKLKGKFIWVHTADPGNVEALLGMWYRQHARDYFQQRLSICYVQAKRYRIPLPEIKIRKMKTRWGSCSSHGAILLNLELVCMPAYCIDYVIMHELCHLKHPNHGPKFYRLLSLCMPDWRSRKEKLGIMGSQLPRMAAKA